jgi:replication factor C subunit 3/5
LHIIFLNDPILYLNFRYPFSVKQEIVEPDWEVYLRETGQKMVSEQSPKALLEVRGRIYELLSHCIAPEMIIKVT